MFLSSVIGLIVILFMNPLPEVTRKIRGKNKQEERVVRGEGPTGGKTTTGIKNENIELLEELRRELYERKRRTDKEECGGDNSDSSAMPLVQPQLLLSGPRERHQNESTCSSTSGTITVIVGRSGSGKTTLVNDLYQRHPCIYIRQHHTMRPYVPVRKIPNFDPTTLPFWELYVKEETASTIKVGGTMAGEFIPGLSGGQRKLLLFELLFQRTVNQSGLLIILDEPFAGVTDDFVVFFSKRLEKMREKHHILLVTNDHIPKLSRLADNKITVLSLHRNTVRVNNLAQVDRDKVLYALAVGQTKVIDTNGLTGNSFLKWK